MLDEFKRLIARSATDWFADKHIALSGGAALELHELTDRESIDIDMFIEKSELAIDDSTSYPELYDIADSFADDCARFSDSLCVNGVTSEVVAQWLLHTKLSVSSECHDAVEVDLAVSSKSRPMIVIDGINVYTSDASVESKLQTFIRRGFARDFYDTSKILEVENISYDALASSVDAPLSRDELQARLEALNDYDDLIEPYGLTRWQVDEMRAKFETWLWE